MSVAAHLIARIGLLVITIVTGKTIAQADTNIVLVAGEMAAKDKAGHHDYIGGCQALQNLLVQTKGVNAQVVRHGWPEDTSVFENANAIVFYTDGGGKQAFLNSPERIALIQKSVDRGVGIVCIHQAIDFPADHVELGLQWLGAVYGPGSGRGHWDSQHVDFPKHPVTQGVEPWKINDGWLNKLKFVPKQEGIVPLVWSSKQHAGSRAGLDPDIVGWVYERPQGGRSFGFSGLDAHSAWSQPGMRQLVVNGILWTAKIEIPAGGAPDQITDDQLLAFQTPR